MCVTLHIIISSRTRLGAFAASESRVELQMKHGNFSSLYPLNLYKSLKLQNTLLSSINIFSITKRLRIVQIILKWACFVLIGFFPLSSLVSAAIRYLVSYSLIIESKLFQKDSLQCCTDLIGDCVLTRYAAFWRSTRPICGIMK